MESVKDNGRVVYVGVNDRAVDLFEGYLRGVAFEGLRQGLDFGSLALLGPAFLIDIRTDDGEA